MRPTNVYKTFAKAKEYIDCACYDPADYLHVWFEVDDWSTDWQPEVDISIGASPKTWKQRIKAAWSALRGEDYWLHNVRLDQKGTERLYYLVLLYLEGLEQWKKAHESD